MCLLEGPSTDHSNEKQTEDGLDAHIYDSIVMLRSDKRKDRVEIPPEQLVMATEAAEVSD